MQHKSFADMPCPIARSLEQVGEWWSILILRDAFSGKRRFDEFQQSLGIAPNMLTRRLAALVEAGMLARQPYCLKPPRDEYVLTERGRDFRTVLVALLASGQRHFAAEAGPRIVDRLSGEPAEPVLVDRRSGRPIAEPHFTIVRGRDDLPVPTDVLRDDAPSLLNAAAPTPPGTRPCPPATRPAA